MVFPCLMTQEFTTEERESLAPFFTNLDSNVFGLKLPQEVAGALFSRYSRSTKSLRRTFLDEFLGDPELALKDLLGAQTSASDDSAALKKARAFYDRVLVGYGDDSVAQLGGAHIACENISNVAAKLLEDARIGIAPLEKSTRYVRFDQKDANGDYLFYREPKIMASRHRDEYLRVMNLLFDTYSRQMEPMLENIAQSLPIEQLEVRDPTTGKGLSYDEAKRDERLKRWAETAYRATVRAHACDVLRSYLPAATLTNLGMYGVGQAFEYLLSKMYSHELSEAKELATAMHGELNQLIPSFVKRAQINDYLVSTMRGSERRWAADMMQTALPPTSQRAGYADRLRSQCRGKNHRGDSLSPCAPSIAAAAAIAAVDDRRSRRRDSGRIFCQTPPPARQTGPGVRERLLHLRHSRQSRTLSRSASPPYSDPGAPGFYHGARLRHAAGDRRGGVSRANSTTAWHEAARLYERIYRDLPSEAQYVVPFAYKIRWYMKMNLREALHMVELRTMPQGHPDYRFICQEMWRKIQEVHPALAECGKFIDWKSYRLGRLQSEMRTEFKKSAMEKEEKN